MAGVNDARLYLTRSSLWKPEPIEVVGVWKTGDDICSRKREVRSLCVRGSSSYQSVDRIVNGNVTGINGTVSPSMGKSNGWKNEKSGPTHNSMLGRFVEDQFVFRQAFVIRSYEIGPDKTATMETIMNLLQETALNHVMSSGLAGDGFGATHEMSLRKLIWVVTRINIQVEKYSCWGDVVEIDTWVAASGKNGMRRDWVIRDYSTQQIITRATSTWVIMNRETRKLSKIPEQVREEVKPFYLDRTVIKNTNDSNKIDRLSEETAESIRSGLAPRWSDMDVNQHVNNVKYIGWILESVPMNVLEDYNLTSMTLEYRRECRQSHLLESLTSMKEAEVETNLVSASSCRADLGSTHLLRMQEDRAEIVRARAEWRLKGKNK
ncbi:palmitoyl-acyl carrier protein thioesterase, chloroplastic-like protein isoform X1 [Cinnamomum micranthum f. kanehirae]|uniref:Acyl-[acyl-carrier-protein] hydrolase n=1 Tax=Cinnamomum micranthum f. kanehirae TaxID=337451 RepID=A0A3S3N2I3_9MAGN|nr:palmitoyl-acyl carrier protein thioesterase, chloroplastic-like protein isoform X1 [Cinnamomum micranthum f. kanehirae]